MDDKQKIGFGQCLLVMAGIGGLIHWQPIGEGWVCPQCKHTNQLAEKACFVLGHTAHDGIIYDVLGFTDPPSCDACKHIIYYYYRACHPDDRLQSVSIAYANMTGMTGQPVL